MDIKQLKQDIINNHLNNFYIFTGSEIGLMNYYINMMSKSTNYYVFRTDDYNSIEKQLYIKDLIQKKYIYIVYEPILNDKIIENLKDNKYIQNGILIFRINHIAENSKIKNNFKNSIVYFNQINIDILKTFIKKVYKSYYEDDYELIISYCNYDYDKLQSELEKMKIIKDIYNYSDEDLYNKYIINFKKTPQDNIFIFIEYLFCLDFENSLLLLDDIILGGESPLVVIQNIFINIRNIISVYGSKNQNKQEELGLKWGQIKAAEKYMKYWDKKMVLYFFNKIREIEMDIKKGRINPELSCYYFWGLLYEYKK